MRIVHSCGWWRGFYGVWTSVALIQQFICGHTAELGSTENVVDTKDRTEGAGDAGSEHARRMQTTIRAITHKEAATPH